MPNLNKDEYVFLMMMQTRNADKQNIDTNVVPFKSMNDARRAMLNVIINNIKNYQDNIAHISYDIGSASDANNYGCVRIEYKNGASKTYNFIRRRIEEVK